MVRHEHRYMRSYVCDIVYDKGEKLFSEFIEGDGQEAFCVRLLCTLCRVTVEQALVLLLYYPCQITLHA